MPTAVQEWLAVHDTPLSESSPCGVLAVARRRQAVPFQTRASVNIPVEVLYEPTAAQKLADEHDTPSRELFSDALGLGVR